MKLRDTSHLLLILLASWAITARQSAGEQPAVGPDEPPVVKGLSIGMSFSRLESWFAERLKNTNLGYEILPEGKEKVFLLANAETLRYLQQGSGKAQMQASDRERQLRIAQNFEEIPSCIYATPDGRVRSIVLRPALVNYLFHATELSLAEFTKQFAEAYKSDDFGTDADGRSTSYTTAQGVKVTIGSDKTLTIKKVASPSDVKKAFD